MKTLNIYIIIALSLFATGNIFSQGEISMQDIQNKVAAYTKQLEESDKFEVVNITIDLIVKDGTKTFSRTLDPLFEYYVVVLGDDKIHRLSLTVDNGKQTEYEYIPESTRANTSINIKPTEYADYDFTVSNAKYFQNYQSGHFAVIIYHQNQQ